MRSPHLILIIPLCLAAMSCKKSAVAACDSFGEKLGEVAAQASTRVTDSAKRSSGKSHDQGWDPASQDLPPGMTAVRSKPAAKHPEIDW
ncbi:hypothetical protein OJ996_21045 [Luteolibacter sp. GHJ8]|uniref:Lipoprotein n=1 Tax=Luteolibacter rhizosphaerae TaxID=2989719 RepID=A0ABT3G917_9BACT|nr:hypothetical protein [Luteolibacter rhizosphaerae]MCW1916089.1 hypothetical protein [Luteolibacter rhizosphaerae]